MSKPYSILVNTCDNFEDCWIPFFTLFKKYWPDCNGQVYLNTEYSEFQFPEVKIFSVKGCEINKFPKSKRATWSQCLIWALDQIQDDIVLYLQEDYFIKQDVNNEVIEKYVHLMQTEKNIHCIHLTDQGVAAEKKSNYSGLYIVPRIHKDRVSCQAALWKKDILKQYIRSYESAWSFEWWGSKRASILNHNFFVVDKSWVVKNKFEIIPYVFTGVIGGKWFNEVVPLFEKNNIQIDYTKRGFFERRSMPLKKRILNKFKRIPIEIRSGINLLQLKLMANR